MAKIKRESTYIAMTKEEKAYCKEAFEGAALSTIARNLLLKEAAKRKGEKVPFKSERGAI